MELEKSRVVTVVITHGERWKFLEKMTDAVLANKYVVKMIVVDNDSKDRQKIKDGLKKYGDRVLILDQSRNLGSAGGFAVGIEAARSIDADFVYVSDDDMVTSQQFVEEYLAVRSFFPDQKVVICPNRVDVPGNRNIFYKQTLHHLAQNHTFFEVFSLSKFKNFLALAFNHEGDDKPGLFVPIVPAESFVYGGAFIPMEAVRSAPLPDASLFLYGDDLEYAWGVGRLGYMTYVAASIVIHDVDLTFGSENHIHGLFSPNAAPFKIYYRIRNMVLLSRRHSKQRKPVLLLSVIVWMIGLLTIGLVRRGPSVMYLKRARLIVRAAISGYMPGRPIPSDVVV